MTEWTDASVARMRDLIERPELPDRYQLEELVGRGGMGTVWRAFDRTLDREVAIKVIAEHLEAPELVARLMQEARILARLEHPGIVAVHDFGQTSDGRAWYVMRFVRGERLDRAIERMQSVSEIVRLTERVCETVAFAHAQGVLHRDLKPSNVMIGPFGEVLVLDWGLARVADDGRDTGRSSGTPGYMAPEQAVGGSTDARADVHGLGAILRDLLAARPEPAPSALLAIRDRALAESPSARYPTALAMRDDLRRFDDGARVAAYAERPFETVKRLFRRYRAPILLVLTYVVVRLVILFWRGI